MADDENYNNTHRAFLQVFLAKGTLTFEEAKPILANIQTANDNNERETLPNDITEPDFNNYITTLNAAISPFDLEIRSSLSQHDRTRIFALVNTTSDAITQLATTHSADEISFLKRVLDAMFETYNTSREEVMAITSLQALKLSRPPVQATQDGEMTQGAAIQGLTKAEAERMMQSLVDEGWFELSRRGYYSLSPRALMELRGWLIETYNEADEEEEEDEERVERVKLCHACREIVTVGQRCANLECPCRLHNFCTRNAFRAQQNQEICPLCKTAWDGQHFVGEKAARAQRASTGGNLRRTTMQTNGGEESEDE